VVVVITPHSQQPEQQVLKDQETIKAKRATYQENEEHLCDSFVKIVKQLKHSEN